MRRENTMLRRAAAGLLLLGTLCAAASTALPGENTWKPIKISWYGQSFFVIESNKGFRVAFDPHLIAEYGRPEGVKADVVVINEALAGRLEALAATRPLRAVALGSGTNAASFRTLLERLGVPVHVVDETDTSYRARALYFADHPPRGWRRLIPLGLQIPPRPIDDYAALLIARRYAQTGF